MHLQHNGSTVIPELALFPNRWARYRAIWEALSEFRIVGLYLSPRVIIFVVSAIVGLQSLIVFLRPAPLYMYAIGLAHWLILVGVLVLPVWSGMRRSLRRQLVEQGIPVCWRCGFDLRGSPSSSVCPECGTDATDLLRRLQRYLPEAAVFPELRDFQSREEAIAALHDARLKLGPLYSKRLAIGACLCIGVAIAWLVLISAANDAWDISRRSEWFRIGGVITGITVSIGSLLGSYAYVAHRTRACLRRSLGA
jgi:hypothetical protein